MHSHYTLPRHVVVAGRTLFFCDAPHYRQPTHTPAHAICTVPSIELTDDQNAGNDGSMTRPIRAITYWKEKKRIKIVREGRAAGKRVKR